MRKEKRRGFAKASPFVPYPIAVRGRGTDFGPSEDRVIGLKLRNCPGKEKVTDLRWKTKNICTER